MTGQRRNDPHHFPAVNGEGHRRRKLVNQPVDQRFDLDRLDDFERQAVEMIATWDEFLDAEAKRRARAETARLEGWLQGGQPGE